RRRDAQVRGLRAEGLRRRDRQVGPEGATALPRLQPRPPGGRGRAARRAPRGRLQRADRRAGAPSRVLGSLPRAASGPPGRRPGRWAPGRRRAGRGRAPGKERRRGGAGRSRNDALSDREPGPRLDPGRDPRARRRARLRGPVRGGPGGRRLRAARRAPHLHRARRRRQDPHHRRAAGGGEPALGAQAGDVRRGRDRRSPRHAPLGPGRRGPHVRRAPLRLRRPRRRLLRAGRDPGRRPGRRLPRGAGGAQRRRAGRHRGDLPSLLGGQAPRRPPPLEVAMIARLIALSARHRLIVVLLVALAAGAGAWSLRRTPLDAIPDLSDVQVTLYTEWMGRSPDLVEDQITYPLISALLGAPRVTAVRGQSMFGMSFVNVTFEEGTDPYWARSRVLEYLSSLAPKLPERVAPVLGPDATGVGWVYEYALVDRSGRHSLDELQSLQGFGISLTQVTDAVRRSNNDVGGRVLEISGTEHFIRGRGYLRGAGDLEKVVLASDNGTPVTIRDVGSVRVGPAQRRGITELDGEGETVGAVVIMRQGENALDVIDGVKARLAELKPTLPAGVEIVPTYDRSRLIRESIGTLERTVVEEMAVVALVILIFLLHVRSTLIPALMLPIAVLLAFVPMAAMRLGANIMSLGGIAIAIGAMVDAAIIVVENVHKRLERWEAEGRRTPRADAVVEGLTEVGRPIFFSLLVITVAFLPVFTLEGTEGRLFKPLAYTKTFSMAFAALLSVTLVPAVAALFIRGRIRSEEENPLARLLVAVYGPICRFALRFRWPVVVAALLLVAATIPVARRLQTEFMPPLAEGTLLYMPTAVPGMSEASAADALQRMDRLLKTFPEVEHVFGKAGRFSTPTDPAPLEMFETVVSLRPPAAWPQGETWGALVNKLDAAMKFTGMPNVWWMPIQTRTEMLLTGVR